MNRPTSPTSREEWRTTISNFDAKERIAKEMSERLRDGDVVGVGSGSTSFLALHALVERARQENVQFTAITSSLELEIACADMRVKTTSLLQLRPDWSFDGADEIDGNLDMIKGRGGAMLREKIIMTSSKERYVLVDKSKEVVKLGDGAPVPVEIIPESLNLVQSLLIDFFEASSSRLRTATGKDGPVITENGNMILDVMFPEVNLDLDKLLNTVPGVVTTGLFFTFTPTVIRE